MVDNITILALLHEEEDTCVPKMLERTHIHPAIILIVEDDDDIGHVLYQSLSEEIDHQVILVSTSRDALDIIETIKPNLFILDYHLPGMNGFELYKRLHALKSFKEVPTIMMSAGLPVDIKAALKSNNISYIEKPFEVDDVIHLVEQTLGDVSK